MPCATSKPCSFTFAWLCRSTLFERSVLFPSESHCVGIHCNVLKELEPVIITGTARHLSFVQYSFLPSLRYKLMCSHYVWAIKERIKILAWTWYQPAIPAVVLIISASSLPCKTYQLQWLSFPCWCWQNNECFPEDDIHIQSLVRREQRGDTSLQADPPHNR